MDTHIFDILWLLISATLFLLMQAGFLCLESGVTRSKNAINVAMKNVADFIITFFLFWLFSFGLMFGTSSNGWIGSSGFLAHIGQNSPWEAAFFLFQSMFCATAATIVSGAIAERVRFNAYLFMTVIIVGLIYPVSGHWAWGGALTGTPGWLADEGFIDFAGSTVVHSVGGWVALAALLVVGSRTGRFKNGKAQPIPSSNPTLALIGALFFVIGWVGFNGGSTLALNDAVPGIIANTILAASSGAIAAYLLYLISPGTYSDHLLTPINGTLAGLVSITANAHSVTAVDAVIIGAIGAAIMLVIDKWMIRRQLDDAIGAVPVHLGAGIWGTLCVALFGDPDILNTGLSFGEQLAVQIKGIVVIGLWAFVVALVFLYILNRIRPLRVTPEEEYIGLNVSEHGAKTELIELLSAMQEQELTTDLAKRVPVEPFTEVGQIAAQHNRVMDALQHAIEQTQAIIRDIRDGILTFGQDGIITSFNPGAEKIFGFRAQTVIGQPFAFLLHPDEPTLSVCREPTGPAEECIVLNKKMEFLGQRASKETFQMEVNFSKGELAHKQQYTASIRDISEKRKIEDQLFQEKERALVTLESIADGVITTDRKGRIEYLNTAAELFTGWSSEDAVGMPFTDVYQAHDEITGELLTRILDQPLNRNKPIPDSGTYNLYSRLGRRFAVQHTAAPIENRNGTIIGTVVVFHDVTVAREMQKQLSHQATHDSLTGLMNRSAFENQVAELIGHASLNEEGHVLCYLDLDQFKLVNDTCGHIAGDELLRQVAQLIKTELRSGDSIARLGGDEFGILLHSCPISRGITICENIREAIKDFRFPWEDKQFSIGVSIGVVKIDSGTHNLSQLLSWADTACYAAKDLGRNRVHLYEPEDVELAMRQGQMQWVSRIRQALDRDQFRLYFQTIAPAASVQSTAGGHYEIFIRMLDENEGVIPPGAFIPAAERYNLMQEIDLWVIKNAMAWLGDQARHNNKPIGLCALNLSGASIGDPSCLSVIKGFFKRYEVRPELVCFEITETAAIANLRAATRFIKELKSIGCKFALDDFGSGLSSFGYLKNLKVDYLKIDGSFIKDIDKDTTDLAMVQSINSIGHVMGLKTIAEFVESETILEKLRDIGIDYVQGYYIDRPRPLEQLEGVIFMPR
jgi:Amt family ammonium transporter